MQDGDSAQMWTAWSPIAVIQQLVKAGANLNLKNIVCQHIHDVHEHSEQYID